MGLDEQTIHLCALVPGAIGLALAVLEFGLIQSVAVSGSGFSNNGEKGVESIKTMNKVAGLISAGSNTFLYEEYKCMAVFAALFALFFGPFVGYPTTIAFLVGCVTSVLSGWVGMKVAVIANVRTTLKTWESLPLGFGMAVRGGAVMGLSLTSMGVIVMYALIQFFRQPEWFGDDSKALYEALAGYGLGGSSIALFGRVGGGIYTKAADVGADLSGKNEWGLDEDDPRNPACIADNVGDNVGDVAGMGADLFGSFAEATCAALVIAGASGSVMIHGPKGVEPNDMAIDHDFSAMMFPLLLTSGGIVTGIVSLYFCRFFWTVNETPDASIEKALKGILIVSTVLQTPATIYIAKATLPDEFRVDAAHIITPEICYICVICGLWAGLAIGFVTEYYTSHSYTPVREISESQKVSAATGVIFGLALGYKSCVIPSLCLGVTICVSHILAGMYGIALGALGMLGTLVCALTIDVYGPISDNAGGIAEMSELEDRVRQCTDALDAAGNTTAAIGKGFAIGSAALVSLALFGAFTVRANVEEVDILNPWTFTGLLVGAMIPYWFSAMTMRAVGDAANDMVRECNKQFPLIFKGEEPKYEECIAISTKASLREMVAPGALVILSPLLFGLVLGKNAVAGLLSGALVCGVQLAISMSNSGGAWDNAKKYIEAGGLEGFGKRSVPHANAVIGDTVGDPLKDTSGPSLNIVVKLSAITSLVFGSVIASYSNEAGGPHWLDETSSGSWATPPAAWLQ